MSEYENDMRGVLFPNKYKEEDDKRPDYTGTVTVNDKEWALAAWKNTSKNGNDYLSLSVSEPREKSEEKGSGEVPF